MLSLIVLFWFIYFVRKPRLQGRLRRPAAAAPLDEDGNPVFPRGEPYSHGRRR